jgi:leucyl aminopeptidase (aminopeptidase T)
MGFRSEQATFLLDVVMAADYREQEQIAGLFFELLGRQSPYEVTVSTRDGTLTVRDTAPWFDLGGRLHPGEQRILPGGEAAYVGSEIEGSFTVDGAILAVPQRPHAAGLAAHLVPLGAQLAESPVTLHIRKGRVERITGDGPAATVLAGLLNDEAYREVTEVGISFNRACARYVHDWPAACNEGRPGVHVALGGDPDPEAEKSAAGALVHVDLMAATTTVTVNDHLFMRTAF